ncbi:MAG: TolC family protein [Magnetococcales bacterium]|nr:TolC family protein [Magnetococcales bacterium]
MPVVHADEAAPVGEVKWRFADLLEATRNNYPEIIARQRSVEAALAELEGAKWQRFPVPSLHTGLNSEGGGISDPVIGLSQPLWTGGRITAGIDAAEARHGAADAEVLATRRSVLLRLAEAYSDLRRRQAQLDIHRLNVQRHEGLREMIDRRVKRQVSPDVDLNLANSRLFQAKNDLSQTVQSYSTGLMQLTELVGQKVTRLDLTDVQDLSGLPDTLEKALELTIANSPSLIKQEFQLKAAQADVDSAEAAYWPQVVLRVENQFGKKTEHRASVSLESQLGAGLSSVTNIAAAQSRRNVMLEERRVALLQLQTTVVEAWNTYTGSRYRLDNNQANRKTAALIFESYTRLYVAGQKSWLDVMNSAKESFSTALAVEDTEADKLSAGLSLLFYTGVL